MCTAADYDFGRARFRACVSFRDYAKIFNTKNRRVCVCVRERERVKINKNPFGDGENIRTYWKEKKLIKFAYIRFRFHDHFCPSRTVDLYAELLLFTRV